MEDNSIVDLYWARSEDAITETSEKYGKYCYAIAYNILSNAEDADESVNDTYLDAWHNMPPHRPAILSTFLGKITRRISIDKWRGRAANKRGGGEIVLALDELADCVPSDHIVHSRNFTVYMVSKVRTILSPLRKWTITMKMKLEHQLSSGRKLQSSTI